MAKVDNDPKIILRQFKTLQKKNTDETGLHRWCPGVVQDYPLSQSHTHAFSISLWNGKTIIMAHTYSHTYIDLLSTWAKKHFSLHGELCWRQTTWMVRSRFVQMTEALLATQKQDLHLPSLLWIYVRFFRNYCEHKALIKEKINKSIYNSSWHYQIAEKWDVIWMNESVVIHPVPPN